MHQRVLTLTIRLIPMLYFECKSNVFYVQMPVITRAEQSLKSKMIYCNITSDVNCRGFDLVVLECFSMAQWHWPHLGIIPNQGYAHSSSPWALQHRSENVGLVIEFERGLWWEHKPDARMFMGTLLCGHHCTQPLSLTAARFSIPLYPSAVLWLKPWVLVQRWNGPWSYASSKSITASHWVLLRTWFLNFLTQYRMTYTAKGYKLQTLYGLVTLSSTLV